MLLVLLTVVAWAVLPPAAHAATQVVTPSALAGWQTQVTMDGDPPNTASVAFVPGPGTPPLGSGSARLSPGADGGDSAQLRNPNYSGTLASSLTALSYSTYATGGSGGQSPYIILQIDTDGDAGIEDLWFFEPGSQSATFCPCHTLSTPRR